MDKNCKVLIPMMMDIHFDLIAGVLQNEGYDVEVLKTDHRGVIEEGLKSVHNDMCYPALLVIGQFIDALKSGKYDTNNVALLLTQTGGGCRASNYIHLLRKALEVNGFHKVKVLSLNFEGLDKKNEFSLSFMSWSFSIPVMTSGLVSAASPHARRISATDPVPMQEHIDFRRLHTQS